MFRNSLHKDDLLFIKTKLGSALRKALFAQNRFPLPASLRLKLSEETSKPRKFISVPHIIYYIVLIIVLAHLSFILVTSSFILIYRWHNPHVTTLMLTRKLVYGWNISPIKYTPLSEIPKRTQRILLSVEDSNFYKHHGFDVQAIATAYTRNQEQNNRMYGGSTLTMQLARTLFLVPNKNYVRKYLEFIVTIELETLLSKDRILELYFNYVEWGKGIFGISTASQLYFDKEVSKLSYEESARIMAVLSSPIRYTPLTLERSKILHARYRMLMEN